MEYIAAIPQNAVKFGEYRAVSGPAKRRGILDEIPIPRPNRRPYKNPPSPDYDQDRLLLSAADTSQLTRISRLFSAEKVEPPPAPGALSADSAQIVTEISWQNASARR